MQKRWHTCVDTQYDLKRAHAPLQRHVIRTYAIVNCILLNRKKISYNAFDNSLYNDINIMQYLQNDKNNKIIRKERNTSIHHMRNGGILPRNLRSKEILHETNILEYSVAM